MVEFDVTKHVPRFLLADKNGYALAKAIEAGIQYLAEKVNDGIKCVTDVSSMPEWRLDEMAWETGCLYDYGADIEIKRMWIGIAYYGYSHAGTKEGILAYIRPLAPNAQEVIIDEYGGETAPTYPQNYNILLKYNDDEGTDDISVDWVNRVVEQAGRLQARCEDIIEEHYVPPDLVG